MEGRRKQHNEELIISTEKILLRRSNQEDERAGHVVSMREIKSVHDFGSKV
jgi:hypothetical protein